jgi:uncharacterized protein (TIGR03118 family)
MRRAALSVVAVFLMGVGCDDGQDPGDTQNPGDVAAETAELHGHPKRIADLVSQVNLVSDQPGQARTLDPNLVNAWGLAFAPAGRAWVSSNEKGKAQVYDGDSNLVLSVEIPPPHGQTESHPTGQVFNGLPGTFKGDLFIFVTEGGTIAGWQPNSPTRARTRVDNSARGANYKGVTISKVDGRVRLYAADFANARIDVYDEHYRPIRHPDRFVDPTLPPGYAPFNVLARGPFLFVTYALVGEEGDDVPGPGNGFVDVFDADGDQRLRLISRGALNAPWGLAFGRAEDDFSLRLYVGNFGDGRINVYRLFLGDDFRLAARGEGPLADAPNHPLSIDGLWAISFGPGAGGFSASDLYFTAGPDDESHGLFGKLVFTPPAP